MGKKHCSEVTLQAKPEGDEQEASGHDGGVVLVARAKREHGTGKCDWARVTVSLAVCTGRRCARECSNVRPVAHNRRAKG